jgi:hypothetical protein
MLAIEKTKFQFYRICTFSKRQPTLRSFHPSGVNLFRETRLFQNRIDTVFDCLEFNRHKVLGRIQDADVPAGLSHI